MSATDNAAAENPVDPGTFTVTLDAAAVATTTVNGTGQCQQARLIYFSVGSGPVEAFQAQASLTGQNLNADTIQTAAEIAASADIDPPGDIHASAAFRRHLARVLAQRVLEKSAARARGESLI